MESQVKLECELHQRECDSCRQRRGEVEALQQALAALAAAETAAGPGDLVEARLREAFRAQMAAGRQRRQGVRWGVAVAAVALLAAAVTVARWVEEVGPEPGRPTAGPVATPVSSPNPLPNPLPNLLVKSRALTPVGPPVGPPVGAGQRSAPHSVPDLAPNLARHPSRQLVHQPLASSERISPSASGRENLPEERPEEAEEALTDYLLLNPGQRFQSLERGQLIRVMVPRSTLGTFGYPINPERAMLPVKADLVVGEDGMARAIRFIR